MVKKFGFSSVMGAQCLNIQTKVLCTGNVDFILFFSENYPNFISLMAGLWEIYNNTENKKTNSQRVNSLLSTVYRLLVVGLRVVQQRVPIRQLGYITHSELHLSKWLCQPYGESCGNTHFQQSRQMKHQHRFIAVHKYAYYKDCTQTLWYHIWPISLYKIFLTNTLTELTEQIHMKLLNYFILYSSIFCLEHL